MHWIQLSREFEAPSTSIHRVDSFAAHVACVAGGISARLQPSLRVVVPRGRHEITPDTRIPPATQTTTYAYSCQHLPIVFRLSSNWWKFNRQMRQLSTRNKTACCCCFLLYSPQNENPAFKNALKRRVYENIVFPNSQGSTTKIKNVRNDDATVPYVVRFQCWSIISPPFLNLKITPNRATAENNTTQLHSRIT